MGAGNSLPSSSRMKAIRDGSGTTLPANPRSKNTSCPGLGHGTPLATGNGDEHFGTAAPFLLEAGLSSSYRIATFWGIAQGEPRRHPTNRVTVTPSIAAARGPRRETPMRPATASAPQPDHWAQDAARRPNARAAPL